MAVVMSAWISAACPDLGPIISAAANASADVKSPDAFMVGAPSSCGSPLRMARSPTACGFVNCDSTTNHALKIGTQSNACGPVLPGADSCTAAKKHSHRSIVGPGEGHEAHEGNGAHPRFTWRDLFDHGELLWYFNGP